MLKVSILTPVYNSVDFIERAIESVLTQNYENFEHIIVDGGSKDGTLEVLKKYNHLKWISEKDNGQSDAMNKAFNLSTGDVISYLNADDYYEEGVFQKVNAYFNLHSDCDMLVGVIRVHMPGGQAVRDTSADHSFPKIRLHFINDFPYNPVGYFFKRTVQQAVGNYPLSNHYSMDYWFLLKVYKRFRVHHLPQLFGHFIMSETNKTSGIDTFKECRSTYLHFAIKEDFGGIVVYYYYLLTYKPKRFIDRVIRKIRSVLQ